MARIIIVEDEGIEALDLKTSLKSMGHDVIYIASYGDEAVEYSKKLSPDLVLMDIVLKGDRNGISAANEIKMLKIPVIYLTAHSEDQIMKEALSSEPYGYIQKPYDYFGLKFVIELTILKHGLEKKIRDSEEKYRTIVETTHEGVAIMSTSGEFEYVNQRFVEMLGYEKEELIGHDVLDFMAKSMERKIIKSMKRLKDGEKFEILCKFYRKDDSVLWTLAQSSPLYDAQGTHYANLSMHNDITSRKEAENALQKREKEYHDLFYTMIDGFATHEIILDNNGKPVNYKFLNVNPAFEKITGLKDVIGKTVREVLPNIEKHWIEKYGEVALSGESKEFEDYNRDLNSYFKIRVFSPKKGQFATIFEDITKEKLVEDDLKKKESDLIKIQNLGQIGSWDWDINTNTLEWSDELYNIFAVDKDFKLTFESIQMMVHPDDREYNLKMVSGLFEGDGEADYEFRIIRPDGKIRHIHQTINVTKDDKSQIKKAFGIMQDITDRKTVEEELLKSTQELHMALDAANAGIWIWDLKTNENIWSEELWALYELEPFSCKPSYDAWKKSIQPEDREAVQKSVQEAAENGKSLTAEWRVNTPKDKEKWLLSRGNPIKDEDGQITSYMGIVMDITQRKHYEMELKLNNEWLGFVQKSAKSGFWDWDMTTEKLTWSPEFYELFGLPIEDEPSFDIWLEILHPEDRDHAMEKINHSIENHSFLENEYRVIKPDGIEIWVLALGSTYYDSDGTPIRMSGMCLDITERKKKSEELKFKNTLLEAQLETTKDGILVVDVDGKTSLFNKHFQELWNIPIELIDAKNDELMIKKVLGQIIDPERFINKINYLYANKEEKSSDEIKLKDGKILERYSSPLNGAEGEYYGRIWYFHDVTDMKKYEKSLKQSEALLRGIFDNMPSGMAVYEVKNDGQNGSDYIIKEFNLASQKIEGMKPNEVIGKSLYDIRPNIDDYGLIPIFRNVWKTGKPTYYPAKVYVDKNYANWYENYVFKSPTGEIIAIYNDVTERERDKEALIESERNYRELVDTSFVGIFRTKIDGGLLFANNALINLLEYENLADLEDKNVILHYKNPEDRKSIIQKLKNDGFVNNFETELITKTGKTINILTSAKLTKNIVSGMVINITDRIKAEKELSKSEERFRMVFKRSNAVMLLIKPESGEIIDANKSAGLFYGYSLEKLRTMNINEINQLSEDKIAIEREKALNEENKYFIFPHKLANGEVKIVEVFSSPIPFEDEVILFSIVNDITDRLKAEDALQESEDNMRLILNSAAEAIYGIDLQGRCTFCNPSSLKLLGYKKPEDLLGKDMHSLIHHKHEDGTPYHEKDCPIVLAVKKGTPAHVVDDVFWRADGTNFFTEYWAYPQIKNKTIIGAVISFIDITERKIAENKIKKSLDEKDILLREIHHRVKNNLQIISSLLHLQELNVEDENIVETLKDSVGRVKSMSMIHEKLYQSHLLTNISLKEYVEKLVYSIFSTYGIEVDHIKTVIEIEEINLDIDTSIPLGLIINELVTNSVKYAFPESNGTLTIRIKSIPTGYELIVADDGVGLPEDVDPKNPEKLGLQLVNSLITQLDGEFEVSFSHGTVYKIKFKEIKYQKRI